jgi:hypothetical protein
MYIAFMISLVVCSIQPNKLERLKMSVESTIGLPHEWLIADNRNSGKGICQVYNELAAAARFPFIVFLHEDVSFESPGWALRILSFFESDDRLGLVGVAGANIKSRSFSGWYTGDATHDRFSLVHVARGQREVLEQLPENKQDLFPVVCLDGVFLFCRRIVWESVRFDEKHLHGFHFYDLDFSLRVSEKFGLGVVSFLGLAHHTETGGDYGSRWVKEAIKFHTRWQKKLPVALPGQSIDERFLERVWLDRLKDEAITFVDRVHWIWRQGQLVKPKLFYSIVKFFLYRPFRLRYIHDYFRQKND